MFKVNNKDTGTMPMAYFIFTYFTLCSSISIVNFELVNASWESVLYVSFQATHQQSSKKYLKKKLGFM